MASLTEEDGDTSVNYFQFLLYSTDTERRLLQVHTSVPTLVDSSKVRRDNKNGRMPAPVSKDTLSQTSSTTTTFGNDKTQDHNSIYTTTGYKSLQYRAKLVPIGLGVAEMGGILAR
jgi:BRCT domain type II-containing protein